MIDVAYEVIDRSSYYIADVVFSRHSSIIALRLRNNNVGHAEVEYKEVGYKEVGYADTEHIDIVNIIGIGLVKIQNRKCIIIVYPSTRNLTILFTCSENMYQHMSRLVNTYRGRIKCNGDI
jgi:hypothetical protein